MSNYFDVERNSGIWKHGRPMGGIYIALIILAVIAVFIILPLMVAVYVFDFDIGMRKCIIDPNADPPEINEDDFDF